MLGRQPITSAVARVSDLRRRVRLGAQHVDDISAGEVVMSEPGWAFERVKVEELVFGPIIERVGGQPGAWIFQVLNQAAWDRLTPDEQAAEKRRAHKRVQYRRRAERLRANGARERYTLQKIGDRDGWTCAICLTPVNRAYRAPDPCTPSIHHRVEVARCGPDTRDNVVLTHLFCNMDFPTRGGRPPAEAREALADRVLYGKHGPGRRERVPGSAAIALAAQIRSTRRSCPVPLED